MLIYLSSFKYIINIKEDYVMYIINERGQKENTNLNHHDHYIELSTPPHTPNKRSLHKVVSV